MLIVLLAFLSLLGLSRGQSDDTPTCAVSLLLFDSGGDGWSGNYVVLSSGTNVIQPTPQDSQGSWNESTGATLAVGAQTVLSFTVPSGASITVQYIYTPDAFPSENSFQLQLSSVVDAFGAVVLGKSSPVASGSIQIPQMDPILAVACGPVPPPVTTIQVQDGSSMGTVLISWPAIVAAVDTKSPPIQYAVSYMNASETSDAATWISLGSTSSASLEAYFPPLASYIFSVSAMNPFGVSAPATSAPYTTEMFDSCTIQLNLLDTYGDGWDSDGAVFVLLNGFRLANAIFPCAAGCGCNQLTYNLVIPADADAGALNITAHFLPPSQKASECSFTITSAGTELFNSGYDPSTGPVYIDAAFQFQCPPIIGPGSCGTCCLGSGKCIYLGSTDGSCCPSGTQCCLTGKSNTAGSYTCCSGSDRCLLNSTSAENECNTPVATCPSSTPTIGSSCYGALTCGYNSDCCCPNEPNDVDKNCGNTLIYSCTGAIGSTWTAQNNTLQCSVDPTFTCPSDCPSTEPTEGLPCVGSKTCNFGTSCCCADEPIVANRLCSSASQYSCQGQAGSVWNKVIITPAPCPATCYSKVSHPGQCPAASGDNCTNSATACSVDSDCAAQAKCCDPGCGSGNTCAQACDCSSVPSCLSWQKVVFQAGNVSCCGGTNVCVDDPNSSNCPTAPTSYGPCVPASGSCGTGNQTRPVYTRDPVLDCVTTTQTQTCTIPCPVDCVGAWGPWGTCTASCGVGYQTQTYSVQTPASNNGKPCPISDGTVSSPQQCSNLPACSMVCQYAVDCFDSYGDGWWTADVEVWVAGVKITTLTVPYDPNVNTFRAPRYILNATRGAQVDFKYILNDEDYPDEASYIVSQFLPDGNGGGTAISPYVIGSPVQMDNNEPPEDDRSLISNCVSCALATPSYCNTTLHRGTCESIFDIDNLCGHCLGGWTNTSNDRSVACVDVDECTAPINPCAYTNATCQNLPGSYTCICPPGATLVSGFCVVTGQCSPIRLRKEWNDLTPVEKDQYVRAIVLLDQKGIYANFWKRHSSYPGVNYAHGTPAFLPWHRQFIYDLECAIRGLGGEFACYTQPYWDFTAVKLSGDYTGLKNNFMTNTKVNGLWTGVGAFSNYTAVCSNPNHAFAGIRHGPNGCIGRGYWSIPNFLGPADMWNLMATKVYTNFHLALEAAHGAIHVWVDGDMGGMASPADPMFFLLHTFIDCVWATWESCNGWTDPDATPLVSKWDSGFSWEGVVKGFNDPMANATGNVAPRDMWNVYRAHRVLYSDSWVKRSLGSLANGCPNPLSFLLSPNTSGPISPPPALMEEEALTLHDISRGSFSALQTSSQKSLVEDYSYGGTTSYGDTTSKSGSSSGGSSSGGSSSGGSSSGGSSSGGHSSSGGSSSGGSSSGGHSTTTGTGSGTGKGHGARKHIRKGSARVYQSKGAADNGYVPANNSQSIISSIGSAWKTEMVNSANASGALEAAVVTGCNANPDYPTTSMLTQKWIQQMKMQVACAQGFCEHPCTIREKNAQKQDAKNAKNAKKTGKTKTNTKSKGGGEGGKPTPTIIPRSDTPSKSGGRRPEGRSSGGSYGGSGGTYGGSTSSGSKTYAQTYEKVFSRKGDDQMTLSP